MKKTYTTIGSIRGSCGHRHRSMEAARTCIARDHSGCVSQGGYSDRYVCYSDGSFLDEEDLEHENYLDEIA